MSDPSPTHAHTIIRPALPVGLFDHTELCNGAVPMPPTGDGIELLPAGWAFLFAGSMYGVTGVTPWNVVVFDTAPDPYGPPPVVGSSTVRMVVEHVSALHNASPRNITVSSITPMLWDGPPWPPCKPAELGEALSRSAA